MICFINIQQGNFVLQELRASIKASLYLYCSHFLYLPSLKVAQSKLLADEKTGPEMKTQLKTAFYSFPSFCVG